MSNAGKAQLLRRIRELEMRRRHPLSRLSDDDLKLAILASAAVCRGEPLTPEMEAVLARLPPAHECRISEFDRRVLHSLSDEEFLLYVDAGVANVNSDPLINCGAFRG